MLLQEEELTFGCGEGGKLIGCTFCFNAAHSSCCGLGDHRVNAPRGDWACPACIDHARSQLKESQLCGEDMVESDDDDDDENSDDEHMFIDNIQDPHTTVPMLKTELRRLGLRVCGRKIDLVGRLLNYHNM